jgi:hypothetical protein
VKNVCFDATDRKFVILIPPGLPAPAQLNELTNAMLGRLLGPDVHFAAYSKIEKEEASKFLNYTFQDEVYALQYIEPNIVNHGHVFGDHVVSLFQAHLHFGLDYPISATNVIILGDSAERNIHRRQFGFIFDPLPLSDTDLANQMGSFCFQHLLISGASWAYADSRTCPISPLMFGLLRKHIRDRFEITDSDYLPPSSRSSAPPPAALNVRVPTKDLATAEHGSYISNIPQIFNYIENTYPQAQ